ncbi:MAG TPA: 23S rRNA (adenine(2503)-C(2))-methyltransferase RlmN [Patescibacteria group bacterium]|nr:23S rRNA (adenine(2503)-C(2))-methyltransferase RlmN [Patescibacteria group bacterium]
MSEDLDLYDLSLEELQSLVKDMGQPDYRAIQLWKWLYQHLTVEMKEMTNLPLPFRSQLVNTTSLDIREPVEIQYSQDNQTTKALFNLEASNYIETVLMMYEKRRTLCISTQAGCAMGCVFCATGQMGFTRNLTTGEIVRQVMFFARELASKGDKITNVVFMGMGEPLHNYSNTIKALDILTHSDGFNLGARKLTISTVGLVPAIRRYADERRQTPLAVSLHAATDDERNKLIPVARRWPIADLMDACHYYNQQTGRRLTFEWALIDGVNDTIKQARLLGQLIENLLCHVNLIPLNPTKEYGGRPPTPERVAVFQRELARYGVGSTIRVRRGIDIQAGCGQLRDRVIGASGYPLS